MPSRTSFWGDTCRNQTQLKVLCLPEAWEPLTWVPPKGRPAELPSRSHALEAGWSAACEPGLCWGAPARVRPSLQLLSPRQASRQRLTDQWRRRRWRRREAQVGRCAGQALPGMPQCAGKVKALLDLCGCVCPLLSPQPRGWGRGGGRGRGPAPPGQPPVGVSRGTADQR